MKKNKILLYILILVLTNQIVFAIGISFPIPSEIEISPGESERFFYQIQHGGLPVSCTEQITDAEGLEIRFDENVKILKEGNGKSFYGSVIAPEDITNGDRIVKFCVTCTPLNVDIAGQQGAGMQFINCGIPINVKVIGERTRKNVPEIPSLEEPFKIPEIPIYYYIIVILVLILLIIWYKYEKKEKRIEF